IQGHDGDGEPNCPIIRADMAVIIDRVMDYQTKAENTFADLGTAYYTDPILRVAQAGVMQGDGKNVRPKDKITREEAVSMLARALSVTVGGSSRIAITAAFPRQCQTWQRLRRTATSQAAAATALSRRRISPA
ncbi:MAG: S-layer homology domain-containing protein, partial [Butyricicoccaceae bacterium]